MLVAAAPPNVTLAPDWNAVPVIVADVPPAVVPETGEMAVTVAWDLSWYQYRVSPDSGQPVRLERRGHELDELEETFKEWNAHVEDEGRLVPEIARL